MLKEPIGRGLDCDPSQLEATKSKICPVLYTLTLLDRGLQRWNHSFCLLPSAFFGKSMNGALTCAIG